MLKLEMKVNAYAKILATFWLNRQIVLTAKNVQTNQHLELLSTKDFGEHLYQFR